MTVSLRSFRPPKTWKSHIVKTQKAEDSSKTEAERDVRKLEKDATLQRAVDKHSKLNLSILQHKCCVPSLYFMSRCCLLVGSWYSLHTASRSARNIAEFFNLGVVMVSFQWLDTHDDIQAGLACSDARVSLGSSMYWALTCILGL